MKNLNEQKIIKLVTFIIFIIIIISVLKNNSILSERLVGFNTSDKDEIVIIKNNIQEIEKNKTLNKNVHNIFI
jgi:hypothetical protein